MSLRPDDASAIRKKEIVSAGERVPFESEYVAVGYTLLAKGSAFAKPTWKDSVVSVSSAAL